MNNNWKFLAGLGVGLALASLLFITTQKPADKFSVISQARELGMIFPQEGRLQQPEKDEKKVSLREIEIKPKMAAQHIARLLKEEGIIRAIGVSNFSLSLLQQAQEYAQVDAIQPEYSLLQREIEDGLLPYCREHSIAVMAYSPLTKGILTGAFHFGNAKLKEDDFRRSRRFFLPEHLEKEKELLLLLKEVAEAKGVSISRVALAWLLAQPGLTSAIVGTQNERHLLDNLQATELQLTQEELARLDQVSRKVIASL